MKYTFFKLELILCLLCLYNCYVTPTTHKQDCSWSSMLQYHSYTKSLASLSEVYDINSNNNCTHPFPSNEELLERAINFLQQEDDFNQLVIIANKTFDIQNQNENKQIIFYDFQQLNENILDVIVNEILEELKSRTILLALDDAEWKMVQNFIRSVNMGHERLFLVRLSLQEGGKQDTEPCFFALSSNDLSEEKVLQELKGRKENCIHGNNDNVIRAVSVFEPIHLFEVKLSISEVTGELFCEDGSYICYKSSNQSRDTWTLTCCAGINADFAASLFDSTKQNWDLYVTPDNFFGGFSNCSNPEDPTTCQWNGMVNELREGRADIAIAAMTMTEARLSVIDFTENILVTKLAVALRNEQEHLPFINLKFVESLDWSLILALVVNSGILFVVMYALNHFLRYYHPRSNKYPIKEAFSYGAGLTFQRDLAGKTPDDWSARIVAISYAVALTIIMSTYMANLTATNVLAETYSDFKVMKDQKILDPTPDFKYGVADATAAENMLKSSPKWRKAYEEFVKNYITKDIPDGIQKLYNEELDGFIEDAWYIGIELSKRSEFCDKIVIKHDTLAVAPAFGIRKDYKLANMFSKEIRALKNKNIFQQIDDKWVKKCPATKPKAFQFEFEYAGGMVILVGIFLLIALVVFILETIYVHWRTKNPRKTPNTNTFDNGAFQTDDSSIDMFQEFPRSYKVNGLTRSDV
ncbi:glutamate receptor ionotropic, NMDA 3A-like [Clytia hemisphaerica]|uniref:Ionotropic glutamate receptor C-terminal domain-containing protein n=1 Tax=Clytia hemisphaerica TaxID=252671 RepID=A0A7M5TW23_9CNID